MSAVSAAGLLCGCLGRDAVPVLLSVTDCVMGLASGLTIKFFPIFLKTEAALPPSGVALVYCLVPLSLAVFTLVAQRVAAAVGRVQVMVANRFFGIALLYWIALHAELWGSWHVIVPVYIIRTSIMNCNYPLQRSILMDYVNRKHRARWSYIEALTSFAWSGSAAVGGLLIKRYDYQLVFYATATMQAAGWAISLLLLALVPRNDARMAEALSSSSKHKRGRTADSRRRSHTP